MCLIRHHTICDIRSAFRKSGAKVQRIYETRINNCKQFRKKGRFFLFNRGKISKFANETMKKQQTE